MILRIYEVAVSKSRLIKFLVCLLLSLTLSGCWSARELNDLSIVVGMGVDKAELPGMVSVTAQVIKPGELAGQSKDGGVGKGYWNVQSSGETVFNAVRDITHKTGNRLFMSHTQVVIFGSEISFAGLQEHFDFLLRAHEMRPNTFILVARGTAADILDVKPEKEKLPAVNIAKLVKAYKFTSQYKKVTLQDFAARLMSKTTSPIAPLIQVVNRGEQKEVYVSGLAVFKKARMVASLNQTESRGLLWVTGDVKSGLVTVEVPEGKGKAILEIQQANSKVTPVIKDGQPYMIIEIKADASLAEQTVLENLGTVPAFAYLEKAMAAAIRQEVMAALRKSQELNADVFAFGDRVHEKYSKEWIQMEKRWEDIYPSLEITINVAAKIRQSNLITKPAAPEKG